MRRALVRPVVPPDTPPDAPPRASWSRPLAIAALALAASSSAFAAGAPAAHQLWVGHLLLGLVAALAGFFAARSWALAGIVIVGAVAYALASAGAAPAADAVQQFGSRYPFHVQASPILVPLLVALGIGFGRTSGHWRRSG